MPRRGAEEADGANQADGESAGPQDVAPGSQSAASSGASDFGPAASWDALRLRARLLARARQFFADRDFLEVETPILSADVVVDRHLDPFSTTLTSDPRSPETGRTLWLQTSPEFAMKRLLAAGAERIYQVTRAFRNGEQGRLHNPEFTILEWYRVGDGLVQGVQLLADLAAWLLEAPGSVWQGRTRSAERSSYREAFLRHAGIDPHTATASELADCARRRGIAVDQTQGNGDVDFWRDLLLVELVEPQLGQGGPSILYDYPASQAALARIRDGEVPVAERFELYVDGIELANGYHELLDAEELRERNKRANELRRSDGKTTLPETSRLLEAMQAGLPSCTGVALGFDRIVMLAAGAKRIRDVMAFPIDRA